MGTRGVLLKGKDSFYAKYIKRVLDIFFSSMALLVLGIPMLIVALLIKIDMGSPVLFKQSRIGKDNKEFKLLKFRSMNDARDENGVYLPDDQRITKLGSFIRKLSIDELPSLLNIEKGDMSIIGPRPLPSRYLSRYTEEQKHRHDVRPGLSMPVLLFYKGGLFEPERTAGIVGPRRCTQETKEKVINVTTRCLKEGQAIISGMALGVDGYAHTAAVKNGGRTIAVVGTGLDICFPKEHETLFEAIENNGCIFSEYESGQPALSCHFPRRNALIAALSDELHVIDAGRNSGAMITAEYAKKYGKKVRKQDDPDV